MLRLTFTRLKCRRSTAAEAPMHWLEECHDYAGSTAVHRTQQHDCLLLLISNHLITLVTKVLLQLDQLLFDIMQVNVPLGKLHLQAG